MDDKIQTVFGIIIAVVFVGILTTTWNNATSIMRAETTTINKIYDTEVSFDISLFDNTLVSGRTINNLSNELSKDHTVSLTLTPAVSSIDNDKTYRSTIVYNANGGISGLHFTEE